MLDTIRRYACIGRGHVWRQDTTAAAAPKAKLSRCALRWALEAVVCFHLSMSRVAQGLGVSWATADKAVLDEGRRVLIADRTRLEGVTVIIDLTAVRAGTGPARLPAMVESRSKRAFTGWVAERNQAWRDRVDTVAIDGFTGFKTAPPRSCPKRSR